MSSVEKIPQHRHCANCKKAFVGEGLYCCKECEEAKSKDINKEKKKLLLIFIFAIVLMVFAIATSLLI